MRYTSWHPDGVTRFFLEDVENCAFPLWNMTSSQELKTHFQNVEKKKEAERLALQEEQRIAHEKWKEEEKRNVQRVLKPSITTRYKHGYLLKKIVHVVALIGEIS